jgi:hypothetical protein
VPTGMAKFKLPAWTTQPDSMLTRATVQDFWLAQAIHSAQTKGIADWRSKKDLYGKGILDNRDLVSHVDRELQRRGFLLSEARFDIDFDGRADRVRRLDIKDCDRPFPTLSATVGEKPDYPLYVVLRQDGSIDEDRMPAGLGPFPLLYEGRTRILQLSTDPSPRNWMRLATPGRPMLGVSISDTGHRSDQDRAKFPLAPRYIVGTASCHLRIDQE